ncbi:MAG: hypothetical protein ACYTG1_00085 [Planctomycetota bacterium]
MTTDPFQRYLGVSADADPLTLLGLTPETCTVPRIEAALRERIARIYRHPDGRGPEAELVCRRVRVAADLLRDPERRRRLLAPAAKPPRRTLGVPTIRLTPFDRHVLGTLVAGGGWNAATRARLVALAAAYGVTVQGLIKVVSGLSEHARSGGSRLGLREITSGAARLEQIPVPAAAAPTPSLEGLTAVETRPWPTLRLSVLFGALTIVVAALAVPLLFRLERRPTGEDVAADVTRPAPAPVVPALPAPPPAPPETPPRLAPFDRLPGFTGPPLPPEVTAAADRARQAPGHLELVARKVEIADEPAAAVHRSWRTTIDEVAAGWLLLDDTTLRAVNAAIDDALLAARTPSVGDELLEALRPPAEPTGDPVDLVRGAWRAGTLGRLTGHRRLPPVVTARARVVLEHAIDTPSDPSMTTFTGGAGAWLAAMLDDLVAVTEYDERSLESWERWLAALARADGGTGRLEPVACAAVDRLLRTDTDLARPGPTIDVVARLIGVMDLDAAGRSVECLLAWFDDDAVDARDLWVLTSVLARHDATPWFGEDLVLPPDAEPLMRRRTRDRITRHLGRLRAATTPAAAAGRGVPVDAVVAGRWTTVLETLRRQAATVGPADRLGLLESATRVNEAAALLAAQRPGDAEAALEQIERALAGGPGGRGPGRGPGGLRGPTARAGQVVGNDGEWAALWDEAGRDVERRLELLRTLQGGPGTDLGPIDADTIVRTAYRGSPQDVRSLARVVVVDTYLDGPNVCLELLDQLSSAAKNATTSEFLGVLLGRVLPEPRAPTWEAEARLALVERVLGLRGTGGPGATMATTDRVADTLGRRTVIVRGDAAAPVRSGPPEEAVEELAAAWRLRAEGLVVTAPVPDTLDGLGRRAGTRRQLVEGPIQRFVAGQVALLELVAFVTAAEQPARADEVRIVLNDSASRRAEADHVLDQALDVELALASLWQLRMTVTTAPGPTGPAALGPAGVLAATALAVAQADDGSRWTARLEALHPDRPIEYFELAEEVADEAATVAERSLARRLFALAGALDPARLGRSACLALADMADRDHVRRRLTALAGLLDRPGAAAGLGGMTPASAADPVPAVAVSEAFGHFRQGRGSRALSTLGEDEAMGIVESHEHALRGGLRRFVEDCKLYRSGLRPTLSEAQLENLLLLEAGLLAGERRSWAADLHLGRGRPLVEVDPRRLEQTLGVDPARSLYRDGRWVEP